MSLPRSLRFCCFVLVLLLLVGSRASADGPGSGAETVHALWVAETTGLLELGIGSGEVLLTLPAEEPVRAVEVDLARLHVWAVADATLRGYDLDGDQVVEIELSGPSSAEVFLEVDGADGSLWVGVGREIRNVAPTGQLLVAVRLDQPLEGLAVAAAKRRVWAATRDDVLAFDAVTGVEIERLQLAAKKGVRDVSVSPEDAVWVVVDDQVQRFEQGVATLAVTIQDVERVAAHADGGAWAAGRKQVVRIAPDGRLAPPVVPFAGRGVIEAVVADPTDDSLWVANQQEIARIGPAGELTPLVAAASLRIWDLGLSADVIPPILSILAPADGAWVASKRPQIQVAYSDVGDGVEASGVTASAAGADLALTCSSNVGEQASCQPGVDLPEGDSEIVLTAVDRAGNASVPVAITLRVDTVPPPPVDLDRITVVLVEAGRVSIEGERGSVESFVEVSLTNLADGEMVEVMAAPDGSFVAEIAANTGDEVEIVSSDAAGNSSAAVTVVVAPPTDGPPDPGSVAPPLEASAPTEFASAIEFLYHGEQPIQEGVKPGTLAPRRVAVIRGRVTDRGGEPLAGVTVRIVDQSQFGSTATRGDGMFDLAVNGGGTLTLIYEKEGYLPVQRPLATPWREFVRAEDVVLLPYDPVVTRVEMGHEEVQVARGSVVEDAGGSRQATLIFPARTGARLVRPSGLETHAGSLSVRATEYTVGPDGPQAMPGPLPLTSGYTYAVELSADEAVAAGASAVEFDQPIYHYVENFLGFPVGGLVPVGFFDPGDSLWHPSRDGRVVRILGSEEGRARVDVTGSGVPAPAEELAELGFSDGELERLTELYAAGQTLWRTPIPHFTPFDCNWPYGPPLDAVPPPEVDADRPQEDDPDPPEDDPDDDPNDDPVPDESDPCKQAGSVIECENQILGERIEVVGTPYWLSYRSDRVPGRRLSNVFDIRISGGTVPSSLLRIELVIDVQGQRHVRTFAPAPHLRFEFEWDGLDAYGRVVRGPVEATAQVGYVYPLAYLEPGSTFGDNIGTFGQPSTTGRIVGPIAESLTRSEATLWRRASQYVGVWDARGHGLGGWSLNSHHVYSPRSRMLYRGDGRRVAGEELGNGSVFGAPLIFSDGSSSIRGTTEPC